MIRRPKDLLPEIVVDELLRLARLDRDWVKWKDLGAGAYQATVAQPSWIRKICLLWSIVN